MTPNLVLGDRFSQTASGEEFHESSDLAFHHV